MFFFKEFTDAGGLASYRPSFPELWRRTAMYVDQILKGASLRACRCNTAKALGLTIPPSLLQAADQVIE